MCSNISSSLLPPPVCEAKYDGNIKALSIVNRLEQPDWMEILLLQHGRELCEEYCVRKSTHEGRFATPLGNWSLLKISMDEQPHKCYSEIRILENFVSTNIKRGSPHGYEHLYSMNTTEENLIEVVCCYNLDQPRYQVDSALFTVPNPLSTYSTACHREQSSTAW